MVRLCLSLVAVAAAIALAGCNETTSGAAAGPVADAPPPVAMSLPSGAACSTEINKYQDVLRADLETGNVAQSVYDQIQTNLARAASACSAGKGSEAHGIVSRTKTKFGYRA